MRVLNKRSMLEVIRDIPNQMERQVGYFSKEELGVQGLDTNKINIIASGTSYNAAFTAQIFGWKNLNLDVKLYYPNFFNTNIIEENIDKDSIYIFISQSGKTKAVLDSLEKVKETGALCLSLTEEEDGPIAKSADISLRIGSEKEPFLFRTSGFTLTTVTLYMIFIELAAKNHTITSTRKRRYISEFSQLGSDMSLVVDEAIAWYENHKKELLNCENLFFAGGSELWPVAQEADIKFMEMIPLVTNSFEIEELIHGPQNSFTREIGFFLLADNESDLIKAREIVAFLKEELNSFAVVITRNSEETQECSIDSKIETFYPLLYITFLQVISYLLSSHKGRDLKVRKNAGIDKYFNKAIQ